VGEGKRTHGCDVLLAGGSAEELKVDDVGLLQLLHQLHDVSALIDARSTARSTPPRAASVAPTARRPSPSSPVMYSRIGGNSGMNIMI
jgi:hypothetical protein